MADLNLQMALKLVDQASAPLRAAVEAVEAEGSAVAAAAEASQAHAAAQSVAAEAAEACAVSVAAAARELSDEAQAAASAAQKQQALGEAAKRPLSPLQRLKSALEAAREAGAKDFKFAADLRQAVEPIAQMGKNILGLANSAVAAAAPFDALIGQAGAAARATDAELSELRRAAYDIGGATTLGANGAAQALASLGMAGLSAKEQVSALSDSLALAEVTGLGAGEAAAAFARAASGFKIPADQTARLKNIVASATDARGALEAMGRASAAASLAGFGAGDTAALFEGLRKGGMGEQASEGVSAAFMALSRSETQKLLKGAGIKMTDAEGQMRPLVDILSDLSAKLQGLPAERVSSALRRAFGEGAKSISIALDQLDTVRARTAEIADDGALARVAERNKSVLMGYADLSKGVGNSLDSLKAAIGDQLLPLASEMAEGFMSAADGVRSWVTAHPALTRVLAVSTVAVGGLLTGLAALVQVMSVASSIKGALGVASSLASAAKSSGIARAAMSGLSSAVGVVGRGLSSVAAAAKGMSLVTVGSVALAVAAVAGLAYAAAVVIQNWDHFSEVWSGYWDGIVGTIQTGVALALKAVQPLLDLIGIDVNDTVASLSARARENLSSGIAAADKDARDGGAKLWAPDRVLGGIAPGLFGQGQPAAQRDQRLKVSVDVSGQQPKVSVSSDSPGIEVPASAGLMWGR